MSDIVSYTVEITSSVCRTISLFFDEDLVKKILKYIAYAK